MCPVEKHRTEASVKDEFMKVLHDSSIFDSEKGSCWRNDPTFVGYGAGYPEQVELLNFTGRPSDASLPCRMEVMLHATMQARYYQRRTSQTQKLSFFYICSGKMYFQSNGSVLLAEPDDCVLLKPHCKNSFLFADEKQCSYYEFILVGSMLDEFLRIYNLERTLGLNLNDDKFFRNFFDSMKSLADVKPVSSIFSELTGAAFTLLQKISSAVQFQARSSSADEIRDFLERRIKEKFSMTEVARKFNIDIHDMNRIFQEAFGVTPYQYLKRFRLCKAGEILRTGMLVKEVSTAVGYQNIKAFSTEFRQFYGKSPLDYRKSCFGK